MSKIINVTTPQKVKIQFEIASPLERVFAFLIDVILLSFLSGILFWIVVGIMEDIDDYELQSKVETILMIIACLFFAGYTLFQDIFFGGQTIGKRVIGLKIIKPNGAHPTVQDYVLRWCFRWIDIWMTYGIMAFLFVLFNKDGQRIGDFMADTVVVKVKPKYKFGLKDLLKIKPIDNYQPKYPNVILFKEEEMVLIKTVLERALKQKNEAHTQALEQTAQRAAQLLKLNAIPSKDVYTFIKDILNDYIILTR